MVTNSRSIETDGIHEGLIDHARRFAQAVVRINTVKSVVESVKGTRIAPAGTDRTGVVNRSRDPVIAGGDNQSIFVIESLNNGREVYDGIRR